MSLSGNHQHPKKNPNRIQIACMLGNLTLPQAPIALLELHIETDTRKIVGKGSIEQAIWSPAPTIDNLKGELFHTQLGPYTQLVFLQGSYFMEAEGATPACVAEFSAVLATDDQWQGQGGFYYHRGKVENVPVQPDEE